MKYKGVYVNGTEVEIKTNTLSRYLDIQAWCVEQFGYTSGYADDTWHSRETIVLGYAVFYFENPKDATLFALRWA